MAIGLSFLLSYWLRFHSGLFHRLGLPPSEIPAIGGYVLGSMVMVVIWLLLFNSRRMYRPRRSVPLVDELINVVRVDTLGMLVLMSSAFFYRDFSYSRLVFGLIWVTSIVFIFTGRALMSSIERKLYRRGRYLRRCLIVGNGDLAGEVYRKLHGHSSFGFQIAGYVAETDAATGTGLLHLPHLGNVADLEALIRKQHIDTVFIAVKSTDHQRVFDLVSECEGLDVEFMLVPDVLDVLSSNARLAEYEGIPFLILKSNPLTTWGRVAKRTVDLFLSSILLVLLSPLMVLIAVLVKVTSKGPVFFRQERVGMDGHRFTMLKFRSMRPGPESTTSTAWSGTDDPRRTQVGVILRKTSLDELPQLLNVFRGEMSLVGPRPERPYFVEQFKDHVPKYLDRHRVKTGMTGWAQVNGLRGDTSLPERIRYDLYYIENWSIGFDIKILLRTLRAAFDFRHVD
jgi:Undecaprenyl-phosphate glucose phosphotransferase